MKKLLVVMLLLSNAVVAQEGSYEGVIDVNSMELKVNFKLKKEGTWKGSMDIPMQNAKGLEISEIEIIDDSLYFHLPEVPGGADVSALIKGDSLLGHFHQMNQVFPFYAFRGESDESIKAKVLSLELMIDSLRREFMVPGVGVAVYYKGKVRLLTGFGFSDMENKKPVDENTVFAIGSSSKAFTAALTVETVFETEGLKLNDPISPYIPGFSMKDDFAGREMSAVDLLCHRSGLPRHDLLWYGSNNSREDLVSKLKYLEPTKPFRTSFQYQNLMYMTAGYFVGQQNNSTWEEELKKRILSPLDMNRTSTTLDGFKVENASLGYSSKNGDYEVMPYRDIEAIGPAGSINSTPTDMVKWVQMLMNKGKLGEKEVLKSGTVASVFKPRMIMRTSTGHRRISEMMYSLGWMTYRYDGKKVLQHGGNIDGFSAMVYMIPEEDFGLIWLTNRNGTGLPNMLNQYATDIMLELDPIDWYSIAYPDGFNDSTGVEKPEVSAKEKVDFSHPFENYAGSYTDEAYGKIEIKSQDDKLIFRYNTFEFEIEHLNREVFVSSEPVLDSYQKVIFRSDLLGNLSHIEWLVEPNIDAIRFVKQASDKFKEAAYLEKFIGEYVMDGEPLKVEIDGDELTLVISGSPQALEAVSDGVFRLKAFSTIGVEFSFDKKGKVESLTTHQPNGDFTAEKVED